MLTYMSVHKTRLLWCPSAERSLIIDPYTAGFCFNVTLQYIITLFFREQFRPEYLKVVIMRSVFSCPMLCLSATVTGKVLDDVLQILQFGESDIEVISRLPNRPNIYLEIVHKKSYDMENDLLWLVDELRKEGQNFPKTLLFSETINSISKIYQFIMSELMLDAFIGGVKLEEGEHRTRLVSTYYSEMSDELRDFTHETFPKPQSNIRLLISTIAFGLGVEITDIRRVIHWGHSSSVLSHWQQVGRAGRDGHKAIAIWYPQSVKGEDKDFFAGLKKNEDKCIREEFLRYFVLPSSDLSLFKEFSDRETCDKSCDDCSCMLCECCNHCKSKCKCHSCDDCSCILCKHCNCCKSKCNCQTN